ncbi:AMP-binding protein [Streptomyces pakalii]|uniref:AMP-binding protein n=1 Tax=Streptomyces pakalii TaxID=3036494 RepID=A0ABT7D3H8_9ACTN|nr:AMP-binding protein [Streptomyces pakalii]MDJ1640253.1 AMP-binding protein [Streptomyces pakalii]
MTTLLTRILAGAGGVFAPDRLLCSSRVTVLNQTPTAFHQLIAAQDEDGADDAVRVVVFGGEALNPTLLKPWLAREANRATRLVNMYGIVVS